MRATTAWLRAARPLAHFNIAPPILVGLAFAYAMGAVLEWPLVVGAFAFGLLDHLFIVFLNDYADRDGDAHNDRPTLVSGGSQVLARGLLRPRQLLRAAILCGVLLVGGSIAFAIVFDRPWTVGFALAAIVLMVAYSLPPLRLSYRGLGAILQGLGVGVVLPLVGFYALAGTLIRAPFESFAPLFVLGFASNIVTALPDCDADRKAKKFTWPVRRGAARARRDALVFVALALLLVWPTTIPLPTAGLAVVLLAPAAVSIGALIFERRARGGSPDDALRFVYAAAAVPTVLHFTWAVAFFLLTSR